jgi:hypothetical protein
VSRSQSRQLSRGAPRGCLPDVQHRQQSDSIERGLGFAQADVAACLDADVEESPDVLELGRVEVEDAEALGDPETNFARRTTATESRGTVSSQPLRQRLSRARCGSLVGFIAPFVR